MIFARVFQPGHIEKEWLPQLVAFRHFGLCLFQPRGWPRVTLLVSPDRYN